MHYYTGFLVDTVFKHDLLIFNVSQNGISNSAWDLLYNNNGNLFCANIQQNCCSRCIDTSLQNKNGTKKSMTGK